MPEQAINATLDLEGLEVLGVVSFEEILNHLTYKMTNAYAEGVTNRVKVIKRQAYGLPNVAYFEDRILVQCGLPRAMRIPA